MSDKDMKLIDDELRYGDNEDYPHLLETEDTAILQRQAELNDHYAQWLQLLSERAVSSVYEDDETNGD